MNKLQKGYKVLIVGDVILDEYIEGVSHRMSAEAPIPVFELAQRVPKLGGAANVAANIQALGSEPILLGYIGDDTAGHEIEVLLKQRGIKSDAIVSFSNKKTTVKSRYHIGNKHMFRTDDLDAKSLTTEQEYALIQKFESLVSNYNFDAIIIEDYDLGVLFPRFIDVILASANGNCPVYVDPKYKQFDCYESVHLLKPNRAEFLVATGQTQFSESAAKELFEKQKVNKLVVTLGADGMCLVHDKVTSHVPTQDCGLVDVCGAGDTVISILTIADLSGYTTKAACELANRAASIACSHFGVYQVRWGEL